jgi:hypothetical protein
MTDTVQAPITRRDPRLLPYSVSTRNLIVQRVRALVVAGTSADEALAGVLATLKVQGKLTPAGPARLPARTEAAPTVTVEPDRVKLAGVKTLPELHEVNRAEHLAPIVASARAKASASGEDWGDRPGRERIARMLANLDGTPAELRATISGTTWAAMTIDERLALTRPIVLAQEAQRAAEARAKVEVRTVSDTPARVAAKAPAPEFRPGAYYVQTESGHWHPAPRGARPVPLATVRAMARQAKAA